MINVSETALVKLQSLMAEEGKTIDTSYIRVGVTSGGCSGLSYKMEIVNEQVEGDKVFEDKGVKILVDKKSLLYLLGTTLEYSGGLNGKGFAFNNPNASRTCGCGESFAV
ncbi:MAG: iron-sulfur cluster assembly accessory protein [Flavobacteriia bacterium]|nr:iron-sulfur cluster assembly accessory protein [Flavobacteriia bacterium]